MQTKVNAVLLPTGQTTANGAFPSPLEDNKYQN